MGKTRAENNDKDKKTKRKKKRKKKKKKEEKVKNPFKNPHLMRSRASSTFTLIYFDVMAKPSENKKSWNEILCHLRRIVN